MQGGAGLAGVGVQSTAEGGAGAAPNPLVEPSEETSENTLACDQKRLPAGVLLRGPDEQEDSPAAEEFDEMFPRKYDVPKTESTLAKDLQTQEGRDRIIANNAAYWQKKKETSDWLDWHPQRFHPRGGISKESIQRVSWLVNKITGIEPRSDQQWDRWRSSCEAMYKEAEGDFEIIEQAIKLKWPDEVQYRSSTPEKYVEAVVKVMAGGVPKPKTRRAF